MRGALGVPGRGMRSLMASRRAAQRSVGRNQDFTRLRQWALATEGSESGGGGSSSGTMRQWAGCGYRFLRRAAGSSVASRPQAFLRESQVVSVVQEAKRGSKLDHVLRRRS